MFSEQCPMFAFLVTGTSEGLLSQSDSFWSTWRQTMRIGGTGLDHHGWWVMEGVSWIVGQGWWIMGGGRSGELFLEHCEANCEDRMWWESVDGMLKPMAPGWTWASQAGWNIRQGLDSIFQTCHTIRSWRIISYHLSYYQVVEYHVIFDHVISWMGLNCCVFMRNWKIRYAKTMARSVIKLLLFH